MVVILKDQTHQELLDTAREQAQKISQLEAENQWLKEQIGLARHQRFGSSSEKSSPEQIALIFNEAELCAEPDLPEPAIEEVVTYKRRKAKGQRQLDLENLEVVKTEYRLAEDQQVCPQCSGALQEMGEDVREEIECVPATYRIRRHVRYKYACRRCQQEEITTPILVAEMPKPAFPGSLASASSVANVMVQKFVIGTPLYRQEQQFERQGLHLTRQTMANWMIKGAGILEPLFEKMHQLLKQQDIAHADETVLQVLCEPGRAAQSKSYIWLYRTGRDGPYRVVLYDYEQTRAGSHPKSFLEGFAGYLHVDGYVGYECLPGVIVLVGCWAHVRRKFDEAIKALPTPARKKAASLAHEGLGYCNQLFAIERELADATPDERKAQRLERSRPVLGALKIWLDEQAPKVLPKSLTGTAINYCRNQWPKLVRFLEDGRLEIDNNRSERSIKPFVIGRKNWLFANTPKGAHASAVIYSMVETAKENGLDPFLYLRTLFERLPNIDTDDQEVISELLPWSPSIQQTCNVPKRRIVESADHEITVQ
jgi:transposase